MDTDVVICNWCTARRTQGAIENIRKYYPNIKIIVVDDASEKSQSLFWSFYLKDYADRIFDLDTPIEANLFIENDWHMGHGLSLMKAIDYSDAKYVWFFDSDLRLTDKGVLEKMLKEMKKDIFAAGYVEGHEGGFVHPMCSLWRTDLIKKYRLNLDEGLQYCIEEESWEQMTTCQYACYQLKKRGYKHKSLILDFLHLTAYNKERWDKYY